MNPLAGDAGDFSDLAVVIAFFRRGIIPQKHDLGPLLEDQGFRSRKGMVRKFSGHFGIKPVFFACQRIQPCPVDGVGTVVVGGHGDIALVFFRGEICNISLVQLRHGRCIHPVIPDLVEQPDKSCIGLAVNMVQFNGDQLGPAQGMAGKKIH